MDEYQIPDYILASIKRYTHNRIAPGGFLYAVLSNNLFESFGRSHTTSLEALPEIIKYLYNEVPMACWGSSKKVEDWLSEKEE